MRKILYIVTLLLSTTWNFYAQNGQIKGEIYDITNNEPIPFANILIDGTKTGTTSDFDGKFAIIDLQPGYIKLKVSVIGYETKYSEDILINNNSIPFINIGMEPTTEQLNEVTIKVNNFKKKDEAPLSMHSIGIKEIENNPGSNRDISKVIQSLPGVGSSTAFRNDVIVRGGGPSESRFFLDGVEIPVLNHFSTQGASGGPIGIINADFIRNVDFYSGSFPADKYNALSGILDFKLKDGSKDKTDFQAALGASETSLTLDGPVGKKTSYIFSVRRSYLQFLFSAIGLPFLPTFNDYQLKVKTDIDKVNQLTIISIGSLDNMSLNTGINNPTPSQEYILMQIPINNQWSYTFGGVYKHFFENGYHTLVLSRNRLNNQFYKYPENNNNAEKIFDYTSTESENKARYELSLRKNNIKYNFSVNLENAEYTNNTSQQLFITDSLLKLNYTTNLNFVKYGFSAQASKHIIDGRLLGTFGFRFDGNTYNNAMKNILPQFSPRFSLSYTLFDKTKLNAGVGRYFQLPAYTTLGYRDNNNNLVNFNEVKYIGANHYTVGIEYDISRKSIFTAEGFYKNYFNYPIDKETGSSLANQGAEYNVVGANNITAVGKGKAVGFELLNRINTNNFTLLVCYTYVRSLFTDINGNFIPSSWDSRNIISLTAVKDFKKEWRLGIKWRFVGGLPYTPYDLVTSSNIIAWDVQGGPYYDYTQLNSLRFKPFHQLDVRIDKNLFFKKWSLMIYLDIQNAYNYKSVGQDFIIREKNPDGTYKTIDNGTRYVLDALPNKSGNILPSMGIMVNF